VCRVGWGEKWREANELFDRDVWSRSKPASENVKDEEK